MVPVPMTLQNKFDIFNSIKKYLNSSVNRRNSSLFRTSNDRSISCRSCSFRKSLRTLFHTISAISANSESTTFTSVSGNALSKFFSIRINSFSFFLLYYQFSDYSEY